MTKKLIDWAKCPSMVAVINQDTLDKGVLLNASESEAFVYYENHICADSCHVSELRLAPADQQPWLVYEEGKTVVPEWAECGYQGFVEDYTQLITETKYVFLDFTAHYKIIGIKAGWPDNHDEGEK